MRKAMTMENPTHLRCDTGGIGEAYVTFGGAPRCSEVRSANVVLAVRLYWRDSGASSEDGHPFEDTDLPRQCPRRPPPTHTQIRWWPPPLLSPMVERILMHELSPEFARCAGAPRKRTCRGSRC